MAHRSMYMYCSVLMTTLVPSHKPKRIHTTAGPVQSVPSHCFLTYDIYKVYHRASSVYHFLADLRTLGGSPAADKSISVGHIRWPADLSGYPVVAIAWLILINMMFIMAVLLVPLLVGQLHYYSIDQPMNGQTAQLSEHGAI